ncbi:MAG TPA: hypothetical protein VFR70_01795 [Flavobacterium sp.]|nr:hypothetical protein [Flavobacterium sp.]
MEYRRNTQDRVQKSLLERFLLVIGVLFFLLYVTLGSGILFWEFIFPEQEFPLDMNMQYRIAFGALLILYAFYRAVRFYKKALDN